MDHDRASSLVFEPSFYPELLMLRHCKMSAHGTPLTFACDSNNDAGPEGFFFCLKERRRSLIVMVAHATLSCILCKYFNTYNLPTLEPAIRRDRIDNACSRYKGSAQILVEGVVFSFPFATAWHLVASVPMEYSLISARVFKGARKQTLLFQRS